MSEVKTYKDYKYTHKWIILCQCFGLMGMLFLGNGFVLNYLKRFSLSDGTIILFLTTIPHLIGLFGNLPFAHLSDKVGRKKLGNIGNVLQGLGFFCLPCVTFFPENEPWIILLGLVIHFLGSCIGGASWFALIDPLINPQKRGRFFAVLRSSWQIVGIVLSALVAFLIKQNDEISVYQYVLVFLGLSYFVRILFYNLIPDIGSSKKQTASFWSQFSLLKENKEYRDFCLYIFIDSFLLMGVMTVINLYEKESLAFTESQIIWLGNMNFIGALAGFWVGGFISDKWGSKLICVASCYIKGLLVLAFLTLGLYQNVAFAVAMLLTLTFGLAASSFGIGVTALAMEKVTGDHRCFGIALSASAGSIGALFMSLLSSYYFKEDSTSHFLSGKTLNHYEIYFLVVGVLVLVTNAIYQCRKS